MKKYIYIYYLVLILVLALYTNMSSSPSTVIRLAYLGALVCPLLNNIAMYPAVVICALGISKTTFAYPFMPTEMYYYVFLSMIFAFLAVSRRKSQYHIAPLFLVVLVYLSLNDLTLNGSFSPIVTVVFIMIVMCFCSGFDLSKSCDLLPFSFILLSLTLSYWILFCPEARIYTYNMSEGMEQVGWRDPNYIACALGTGLVIAVKEILSGSRSKWLLFLMLLTVVLSVFALLTVASRGMSLAVATSVSIMLLFSKVKKRTKALSIIGIIVFIVFLYTNEYFDFLISRFNMDDGTGSHRTEIWADKLKAFINDRNVLNIFFGFGQDGGFKLGGVGGGRSTHNDFVAVLIYYGIVGFALFLSIIAYPLKMCSKKDRPQIAALMIYLLLCSMTIEPLCMGNLAYIGFYFYITQLARQSRLQQIDYA